MTLIGISEIGSCFPTHSGSLKGGRLRPLIHLVSHLGFFFLSRLLGKKISLFNELWGQRSTLMYLLNKLALRRPWGVTLLYDIKHLGIYATRKTLSTSWSSSGLANNIRDDAFHDRAGWTYRRTARWISLTRTLKEPFY